MTVAIGEDGVILLQGVCTVEDAETLAQAMLGDAEAPVDWTACDQAHMAVLQVMMADQGRVRRGPPRSAFLAKLCLGSPSGNGG